MLRYFNILLLFLAIKRSFCYNYIDGNDVTNSYNQRANRERNVQRHKREFYMNSHNRRVPRQEYEASDDKEPLAEIDVASFIRKPDEYAIDDSNLYNIENAKGIESKALNDYGSIDEMNDLVDAQKIDDKYYSRLLANNPDATQSGVDKFLYDNKYNTKQLNNDPLSMYTSENDKFKRNDKKSKKRPTLDVYERAHKPQKKCCIKSIQGFKLPFFSLNKTKARKAKKEKKRKIFGFHGSKKDNKLVDTSDELHSLQERTKKEPEITTKSQGNKKAVEEISQTLRNKRNRQQSNVDRQMKELANLQQKVDYVQVTASEEMNSKELTNKI